MYILFSFPQIIILFSIVSFLHLGKHELDGASSDSRFPDDCFINLMWEPVSDQAEIDKMAEANTATDEVYLFLKNYFCVQCKSKKYEFFGFQPMRFDLI